MKWLFLPDLIPFWTRKSVKIMEQRGKKAAAKFWREDFQEPFEKRKVKRRILLNFELRKNYKSFMNKNSIWRCSQALKCAIYIHTSREKLYVFRSFQPIKLKLVTFQDSYFLYATILWPFYCHFETFSVSFGSISAPDEYHAYFGVNLGYYFSCHL